MPDPSGWDRYAHLIGGAPEASPQAAVDDGWGRYRDLIYGRIPEAGAPADTATSAPAPVEDTGPSLLDRAGGALSSLNERAHSILSSLNPLPAIAEFGRDIAAAHRVAGPGMEMMATEGLNGHPLQPAPIQREDVMPAVRGLATAAFPYATAAETAVGGLAGALTGQPDALKSAYQEGAFGPISRATGLDQKIAELGQTHPNLATTANVAGTVLTSGGIEAGLRKGAKSVLERATDIGDEVAVGIKEGAAGLGPSGVPGVRVSSEVAGIPPTPRAPLPVLYRQPGMPAPAVAHGPAIPMSGAPTPEPVPSLLDPGAPTSVPVRPGEPLIQPAGHLGRGEVRSATDPREAAALAEERTANELQGAREQQVRGAEQARADAARNEATRRHLASLGLDYAGVSNAQVLPAVAGATGGALSGDTPEDRLKRGLVGGLAGLAGGTVLKSALETGGRATVPAYLDDPDVKSILSQISTGKRTPKALRQRIGEVGHDLYTRLVDQLHPLNRFGKKVGGSDRLAQEAARASGWQAAAEERLKTQFKGVVDLSKGNEQGAVALSTAERALELAKDGYAEKGIDLADAQRTVQKLSQIPGVKQAADALRGYYRQLLDYKLANGVITPEAYDRIVKSGEVYVPFVRDLEEAQNVASAGGGRLVNRGSGVRKMTDSEVVDLPIVDPYKQAILDTFEAERTVAKQRVSNVVAQIVEDHPDAAGPFIVRVKNPADAKGPGYVQANVGGTRRVYKVMDPGLFNAWASFDPHTQTIFTKILRPFKTALRVGVTALPDFAVANAIRDNAMASLQYSRFAKQSLTGAGVGALAGAATDPEHPLSGALKGAAFGAGGAPLVANMARTLGAMRHILGNDDVYQEWVREGGAGFGWYAHDPQGAAKILHDLQKEGVALGDVLSPKSWWHTFQAINHAVEQGPRLARYTAMRGAGADVPSAIASSRDISLDFRRIGKDMRGMSDANAFLNAQVQGWDKLARMLTDKRTWAAGATMLTAPTIALWQVNKDNPEYWSRPSWEKNLFWLVPKGGEGNGFWRIPKPFEIGFIFASLPERLLDYAHQKDPEALKRGLGDMASTYGVSSILPLTTAATPVIEDVANYDLFRNRPIVSDAMQRLPADLQYDEDTSTAAVKLGGALGISPEKIDHLLTGWTGSAGQAALDATSDLARGAGLDTRPEPAPGRTPLVGRFSTRPDQTSDAEALLYDRFSAGERAMNGLRQLAEGSDRAAVEPYVRDHADELRDYYALKSQAGALAQIRKARRQVREADIPAENKGRALAELSALAAQIASAAPQGQPLAQR